MICLLKADCAATVVLSEFERVLAEGVTTTESSHRDPQPCFLRDLAKLALFRAWMLTCCHTRSSAHRMEECLGFFIIYALQRSRQSSVTFLNAFCCVLMTIIY